MAEIQHRFSDIYDKLKNRSKQIANIYDRLNNQPHLQELIATPLLQQLDYEDMIVDQEIYRMRAKCWQDLLIYNLSSVIENIAWDTDHYAGSFASYVLFVLKP